MRMLPALNRCGFTVTANASTKATRYTKTAADDVRNAMAGHLRDTKHDARCRSCLGKLT